MSVEAVSGSNAATAAMWAWFVWRGLQLVQCTGGLAAADELIPSTTARGAQMVNARVG